MEQFISIIEKERESDLIPFLQSLSNDQKKKLSPTIKKFASEFTQYGQIKGTNEYGYIKGTDKLRDMLQMASFVCFNLSDYEKSPFAVWMLENAKVSRIIDWYCPDWFSDFVNKQVDAEFIPYYINYNWIMELAERGFLNPRKELVAKLMPNMIFETDTKRNTHYKPEHLLKRKITLEEHIWYLFEVATDIHYSGRFLYYNGLASNDKSNWHVLLKQFSEEKRIDRLRLLREALQASNRNFNKVLSGWFAELFIILEPSKEEIVTLQPDLFSVLGAMHSKPVNTSLQAIKKIIGEKGFDVAAFLDNAPVLLSSSTKATVVSALMILEKLAQGYPVHRAKICSLACQAFIQSDNDVHTRVVKIITKNADKTDTALREEIGTYYTNMTAAARLALKDFTDTDTLNEITALPVIDNIDQPAITLTEITFPANIEDLIFLASQAFDNNEPWHTDVLPAAILHFHAQIRAEDVPRFEPAFQRALGLVKNGFRSGNGYLDHLLAMFFIDFGHWLILKFPEVAKESIEKVYRKHDPQASKTSWLMAPKDSSYTEKWTTHKKIPFYDPYHILLIHILEEIKRGSTLPVLSTPTHENGWIEATILIDRLHTYQNAGQPANSMDLQIAISRCSSLNSNATLEYAAQKLKEELRELVVFLLDETARPQGPFKTKEAWIVASLTKKEKKAWKEFESFPYSPESFKNHSGQLAWEAKEETRNDKVYDFSLKKYISIPKKHAVLHVHKEKAPDSKASGLKKFISGLLTTTPEPPVMLYDLLILKAQYIDAEHNDIKRILSLTPGNPAPILADVVNKPLSYSVLPEEMIIKTIEVLHETWNNPGEMEYLFLGNSMLTSNKTIASIAGEIWLKAVMVDTINNAQLGKVIGLHQMVAFAPMKRFTDLISQQLFRISALHNRALQTLIEHVLKELSDEPIKNLKKLLEIYIELVAENGKPVLDEKLTHKLKVWNVVAGWQKLLKPLLDQ